jgi:hypothetical protein
VSSKSILEPERLRLIEVRLSEAVQKASDILKPDSLGILYRTPLADEDCPEVSDVDLVSIWERPEEFPQRITIQSPTGRVYVDVLWIPASKMVDPFEAASYKILPHLLKESKTAWLKSEAVRPLIENIKLNMYDAKVWAQRIGHQINFGDAALQEARKNLDFPSAALFFLQTANSYYVTALADCLKQSTMSLLTRPVNKLRRMAVMLNCDLESNLKSNLHLEIEPSSSLVALGRVYNEVAKKCLGRKLCGVSMRTRGHYEYSISSLEFEYRDSFAKALIAKGDCANANFYIRFWAYTLSRCPVVLQEVAQGQKPSFYVPCKAFKESVDDACPQILEDMKTILGGELTLSEAEESIEGTLTFRAGILDQIKERGISCV